MAQSAVNWLDRLLRAILRKILATASLPPVHRARSFAFQTQIPADAFFSVLKLKQTMEGKEHEIATTFGEEVTTNEEFVKFDPSRMIGIIKRRALIKDLAAAYHAECIACGQELLHLQKKWEETAERRAPEEIRKRLKRPTKRAKKEH